MKQITKNNKIFKSELFLKDSLMFHIIFKNFDIETLMLYSDEENYLICRGAKHLPTWIWTKDNLSSDILPEIKNALKFYIGEDCCNKFTCKRELYDLFKKDNFSLLGDSYFEMGFLQCNKTKKPKECDGTITKPSTHDFDTLAEYWYHDVCEMDGYSNITYEQAAIDMKEIINNPSFFVWKNCGGKIVCMAEYSVIENQGRIGRVYTPPEERCKGYAANLIYELANKLLNIGAIPILYTDYHYPASNKAYINAGFETKAVLINFNCSLK